MKSIRENKGFTLIEIIVAMMIICIVLVPILEVIKFSLYHSLNADLGMGAIYFAQGLLEEYRGKSGIQLTEECRNGSEIIRESGEYVGKIIILPQEDGNDVNEYSSVKIVVKVLDKKSMKEYVSLYFLKYLH